MQVAKKPTRSYNVLMKDFREYRVTPEIESLAKSMAVTYEGKSEKELYGEIYRKAEAGKRAGTLTNAQIDAFFAQVSPMLDGTQRKKLQALVEKLKQL